MMLEDPGQMEPEIHIITVSRQFGSGGRELGRCLSDVLGWDYYDKEVIDALAQEHGMEPDYIRHMLSHHGWHNVQLTYKNSFAHLGFDHSDRTRLLVRQREMLLDIARAGNNCVIVGRDADVILREYHPFRLCICADEESRLKRCMAFENKKPPAMQLSEKEVLKNIRRIDKNRARTREILTGKRHGDASAFDLIINAANQDLKQLAAALADFSRYWFREPVARRS